MERVWSLQDAKNKFSNVVEKAQNEGPQVVTKRGVETVVVLSITEYRKLARPGTSLVDFFQKSPFRGIELDIKRSKDLSREVEV